MNVICGVMLGHQSAVSQRHLVVINVTLYPDYCSKRSDLYCKLISFNIFSELSETGTEQDVFYVMSDLCLQSFF